MAQEPATTAAPVQAPPQGEALLPDGIGLSLEQAQTLIVKSNGVVLANDEPALMGITLCNAYLTEIENSIPDTARAWPDSWRRKQTPMYPASRLWSAN